MKIFSGSPLTSFAWMAPLLIGGAGCASAGYPSGVTAGPLPRMQTSIATAASSLSEADVVIIRQQGSCAAQVRDAWMTGARERIDRAIRTAYADLPIDHGTLSTEVGDALLSQRSLCAAVANPSGGTRDNHAGLRRRYQETSLPQGEALSRGIAASLFSPKTRCDDGRDWSRVTGYIGISECGEIASKLQSLGIPFALFGVTIDPVSAQSYLQSSAVAPFFMRYTNSGPVACGEGAGYRDNYHSLYVSSVWSALTYIERSRWSEGDSSCSLIPSCTARNGERYEASDLLFGFGLRVYLKAEVEIDGERKPMTLIISSTAAASGSWLAGLLPRELPYERYLGSELVKKIVLEAAANGW